MAIIFPFIIRTLLIRYMGKEYVGMGSLFSSVLQVLNMTEMGISSAIIYNMYRPVSEHDDERVNRLLNYYRSFYLKVAFLILVLGMCIMPFLNILNRGKWPDDCNYYIIFFLYLINSCTSYVMYAYYATILNVRQRIDLLNEVYIFVDIIQCIAQVIAIVRFKSYYLFVAAMVIATVLKNLLIKVISERKYPQYRCKGEIDPEEKTDIMQQIKGLFIGKIGDVSRNSFDSIVISIMLGLSWVAVYSNYFYIFSAAYSIILAITHSIQATVGNEIAAKSKEANFKKMFTYQFFFMWIITVFTACLYCLYQPFIKLWLGEEYLLDEFAIILFCIYFYVLTSNNARNLYYSGNGLWWQGKAFFIMEALGNLLLNFLLGYFMGIHGILYATIITVVLFNYIGRSNILFKYYFDRSPKEFYLKQIIYLVIGIVIIWVTKQLASLVVTGNAYLDFVIMVLVALVVSNALLLIVYFRKITNLKGSVLN